jgi:glycosyltransferase involved in cell wall biosynthesis
MIRESIQIPQDIDLDAVNENGKDLKPSISVIIPAYNEELVIGQVVKKTREILESHGISHEIIVIDDGSTDATYQAALVAGANVLSQSYNIGNGAAIKRGIRSSKGDILVFMDGDGQHDPEDILRLLEFGNGYEMVVGARSSGSKGSFHRNLANKLYNILASYIVGFIVRDLTSGFRAIDARLARKLAYLLPNGYSYPSTMTIALFRLGYRVKYIPIKASSRVGRSKIKLIRDGLKFLLILARIGTLYAPLRIFLPLSAVMFFPGFFYAIIRLSMGRSWTIPIVISLITGLLFFSLGLISEQIALLRMSRSDE